MSKLLTMVTEGNKPGSIYLEGDLIVSDGKYLGEGTDFRPVHCTELREKLHDRGWGNECFKFYSVTEQTSDTRASAVKIYVKTFKYKLELAENYTVSENYVDDGLPIVNQSAEENESPDIIIPKSDIDKISNEVNNAFDFVYENQRGERELRVTRSSKNRTDIVDDSITIEVINSETTSTYTNTVDLNGLIKHVNIPGISAKVDLTYQYSVKDSQVIRGGDLSFKAFEINEEGNVEGDNRIFDNGEITVEYINGIIRIFPASNNINECILSDVIITYGNLEK
jgi:hypothetical protein